MYVRCEGDYGPYLRPEWGEGKGRRDRDGGDTWGCQRKEEGKEEEEDGEGGEQLLHEMTNDVLRRQW